MIVKSLSKSSAGSSGQLLGYIFRYILEKEQKEAQEKGNKTPGFSKDFSKEDVHSFQQAFENGHLNFSALPYLEISAYRSLMETELDSAVRIAKTTALGKEIVNREKAAGSDLKKTQLYLTPNYLIARSQGGDRFFKLSGASQFSNTRREPQAKEEPFIIRHNVRTRSSIPGFIREFEQVESLRIHQRSNSVSVYHHIISFSSKDKEFVTDAMLKDLAEKFIALRSPDSLFVGTKHTDRDHIHLHLAMSAVDLAGRSVRISQSKFQELKTELQRYQAERYPELSHSLPDHGRKSRAITKEADVRNIKNERASDKATLLQVLESTFAQSTSTEHFLSQLREQGYQPYYRSGTLTGISTEGERKFRFARLGYNQQKISSLNQAKEHEEKVLEALRALRENSTRDRIQERLATLNETQREMLIENNQLEEQQSIQENRESSRDKEDDRSSEPAQSDRDADSREQGDTDRSDSRADDSRDR